MPADKPHVVLVCWGFPPFRGSGVFRPLALANGLAAAGADVTVITATREVFVVHYGADPSLEKQLDAAIEVVRVPFYPPRAWPLVNDWPRRRITAPKKWAAQHDPATDYFPEKVYASWLPRATEAVYEVHQQRPISLLLGSGGPYVDDEAASQVAGSWGIPLVLDDRDSFLADVFTGEPKDSYADREPFFKEWMAHCAEMWFVNPPLVEWHRQRFPEYADRFHVVENGWDAGVVDAAAITPTAHSPLRAGYVGLVPTNFPMTPVLNAWQRVAAAHDDLAHLRFTGPLGYSLGSESWRRAEQDIVESGNAEWSGHVPREELASAYAELDVLLLIKEGGTLVTGGKTYEYAATGLPIAALVDPRSDAIRVLRDYPRLHVADPHDPKAAATAIAAAIADRRSDDGTRLRQAQQHGAALTRDAQLSPHIERILRLART